MDSTGSILLAACVLSFLLFFIRISMIAYRCYALRQAKTTLDLEQSRRQMELSVTSNATHMDNSSVANTEANNDMSILPKGMDLPPSYDELSLKPVGASTLTITTNLSASNPALNEPPPEYELTTSTTTTTTVVINNNSNQ
ncbi:uncharacterized protein LOC108597174 isoform X1 [Drosophila busckii]|uniref:uncharacterized protein LOC108597174 isoform X1 n=1 Tax=Drosophila busckii TaxID=30019 RepID=UPI00083ECCDE|nr:uncharacterized protein LOC108597174 isoform X1 [Drosophila busckii]